jgi:hypothetical protein
MILWRTMLADAGEWLKPEAGGSDAPMLVFRLICAVMVAWAMNWALRGPEAVFLQRDLPEFVILGPIAGALVGWMNLAKRQGWGMIVAIANGMWAGFLSLLLTGAMYVGMTSLNGAPASNMDVEQVFALMSANTVLVVDGLSSLALMIVCLGSTALVGIVTEVVHWAMVKMRRARGVRARNTRKAQRPSMY